MTSKITFAKYMLTQLPHKAFNINQYLKIKFIDEEKKNNASS